MVAFAVVLAGLLGLAFRGSLDRFGRPPLTRNGLLAFGVLAQATALVARHPGVYAGWLGFGAAALVLYAVRNRGRPGLLLAAGGLALNVVVIAVNWAMPVSLAAAAQAGVPASRLDLATDPLRQPVEPDTLLPWLSESIPLALPLRPAVVSPGDLLAAAGGAVFVFTGLTGHGRPAPRPTVEAANRSRRRSKDTAGAASDSATAEGLAGDGAATRSAAQVGVTGAAAAEEATAAAATSTALGTPTAAGRRQARAERANRAADGTPESGAEPPTPSVDPSPTVDSGAPAATTTGDSDRKAARQARRAQRKVAGSQVGRADQDTDTTSTDHTSEAVEPAGQAQRRRKQEKRKERKATGAAPDAGSGSQASTDGSVNGDGERRERLGPDGAALDEASPERTRAQEVSSTQARRLTGGGSAASTTALSRRRGPGSSPAEDG